MHAQSITLGFAPQWRDILGYPGYQVSSEGEVRSFWLRGGYPRITERWRLIAARPHKRSGHLRVGIYRDRQQSWFFVHRLVLEAFVGPCPEGMEACHNDGDPSNNSIGNLRWDTRSENMLDALRHGTLTKGEARNGSKLTEGIVVMALELRVTEGVGAVGICNRLGLPRSRKSAIDAVIEGRNWRHITNLPKPCPKEPKPTI